MAATDLAIAPEKIHVERVSPPPIAAPPLRVSFSWTLAGNMVYAATQFGVLSALAKLGSATVVGQYALALAIAAPVFMFTNLQLRGVQATDARDEYQFADYFTLRCLSTFVGFVFISGVISLSHYDPDTKWIIVLIAAGKAIETFSDVIAGHLQKFERLDQVARALMIRGLAAFAMFVTVFWVTRNLLLAVSGQMLAWLGTIALYDLRVLPPLLGPGEPFLRLSLGRLQILTKVSLPLGIVMTLLSLSANIPRYILENRLGVAQLGVFASLAYVLTSMNVTVMALGQSVSARLSRFFADSDVANFETLMQKLVFFSIALGGVATVLALIAGNRILNVVYGPEYAGHVNLFCVLVLDATVMAVGSFLGFGMTAARVFRPQVPVMLVSVITSAVLTWMFVTRFGLLGAGYALMIASLIRVVASHRVLACTLKRIA
jgi:O-antigen/teichoic acid export membrane protein